MATLDAMEDSALEKEFTVESFLNNPMGDKGSSVMGRAAILSKLHKDYQTLLAMKRPFKVGYFNIKKDTYIKIKVPSESYETLYYDVVIKFKGTNGHLPSSLNPYKIEFFSNAPSFTFTYAHAFDAYGCLIPELKKLFDKKVFQDLPINRNPDLITFYEKTITFALFYIKEKGYLNTNNAIARDSAVTTTLQKLIAVVPTADEKLAEHKKASDAAVAARKQERAKKKAEKMKEDKKSKESSADFKNYINRVPEAPKKRAGRKPGSKNKVNNTVNNQVKSTVKSKVDNKVKS